MYVYVSHFSPIPVDGPIFIADDLKSSAVTIGLHCIRIRITA